MRQESFHSATIRLLGNKLRVSRAARSEVDAAESRLGVALPASVREWYCNEDAIDILAKFSNKDWPIPLREFAVKDWLKHRLLPFKVENQGVCIWAIMLDGSNDPPVYIDVDSNGAQWNLQAPTFSAHIHACVWDHEFVLDRRALVQAQNKPLFPEAVGQLRERLSEEPSTFAWPGRTQYRFAGEEHAILIWSGEEQADWFIGADDPTSLESALRAIWKLDDVGQSLYDCTEIGKAVLCKISGLGDT